MSEERIWTADLDEFAQLERFLVRRVQVNPNSAYNHFLLSKVYLGMFEADQQDSDALRTASDLAAQAVEIAPDQEFGYVAMAEILQALGHDTKALAVLEEGFKNIDPRAPNWRIKFVLARLLASKTKADETLKAMLAVMNHPATLKRVIAPYIVVIEQSRTPSNELLIAKVKTFLETYPKSGFEEAYASILIDDGRFEQAHRVLSKLRKSGDTSPEMIFTDAILAYRRLGQHAIARNLLEQLDKQITSDESLIKTRKNIKFQALIHAHLAAVYLRSGDTKKSRMAFKRAFVESPDKSTMVEFIAREYRSAGAHKDLVKLLTEITEEGPGDSIVHAYLAEELSVRVGNQKAAVSSYRNAIILDPTRSDYYNGLGLALYRQMNFEAALHEFSRATEIDPGDASARYNEACALALLGRGEEALYSLREALQLEPQLIEQAKVDKDFASINTSSSFQQLIAGSVYDELIGATASRSD